MRTHHTTVQSHHRYAYSFYLYKNSPLALADERDQRESSYSPRPSPT